ncbi:MAG: DUF3160 domain-containing protein [Candidatus Sabulitectum sp.]|nr:DUF3160 domain-containing protein [Candidatus Sabulitectum sp.]
MKRVLTVSICTLLVGSCSAEISAEDLSFPREETMEESFSRFYTPVEYTSNPGMEQISLPLEADVVINLMDVLLIAGQSNPADHLVTNGFAVFPMPRPADNPVRAFELLDGRDQPIFVSSGIPLHMLHIFFDQILQQVETDHLYPDLLLICRELYQSNLNRNNTLNAAFFAVPLTFLDEDFEPHSSIAEKVSAEVSLMEAHQGFNPSPVFGYKEDYSQYVPRGHYTASEELENYFMAMMYMGRITFLLTGGDPYGPDEIFLVSEETAEEMTEAALLVVSDLNTIEIDDAPLKEKWQRIYEITAFFAGFADDLSASQYQAAAENVAGERVDSPIIRTQDFCDDFKLFIAENFAGPSIYSGTGASVIMPDASGEFDPEDFQVLLAKTTGFRFFGQRYTPDSEMLGKFVFPNISRNPQGRQRFMPSGLDVAASFRCQAALDILEEDGTMLYGNYPDTLAAMQEMVDNYTEEDWHATLYMCWLHSLRLLSAPREEGYPDFMQTDAWDRCTLSTFLASWAMLRHDTILYAKQSYTAEAGCCPPTDQPVPSAGFVEPVPEVYAELRATLQMARKGLEHYDISDDRLSMQFERAESLLGTLQSIAERELAGEMLTESDADFLKGFAEALEATISWGEITDEGLETSLIADVHTDQNTSSVLEVASGNLDNCVVIYRRADGVVEAAIGPVLSYYQFSQPMNDRLTDEAWRTMLRSDPPARPEWTGSYICR